MKKSCWKIRKLKTLIPRYEFPVVKKRYFETKKKGLEKKGTDH